MGNVSKYEGGSTMVAFRLPTKYLKEAKAGIELFLEMYRKNKKPTVKDPLTVEKKEKI